MESPGDWPRLLAREHAFSWLFSLPCLPFPTTFPVLSGVSSHMKDLHQSHSLKICFQGSLNQWTGDVGMKAAGVTAATTREPVKQLRDCVPDLP